MWAYVNRKVHPEVCLTRSYSPLLGAVQAAFKNVSAVGAVRVRFVSSKK